MCTSVFIVLRSLAAEPIQKQYSNPTGSKLVTENSHNGYNLAEWNTIPGNNLLIYVCGSVFWTLGCALVNALITFLGSTLLALFGLAGAYFRSAIYNRSWSLADWNFGDSRTYESLLNGFGTALLIGNGIASNISFLRMGSENGPSISNYLLQIGINGLLGAVTACFKAMRNNHAFWTWNWRSRETWAPILEEFGNGLSIPVQSVVSNMQLARLMVTHVRSCLVDLLKHKLKRFLKIYIIQPISNLMWEGLIRPYTGVLNIHVRAFLVDLFKYMRKFIEYVVDCVVDSI